MRRYERKAAAELLHLDTKKRACFAWPGHRVTGDRSRYTPRTGWQALPVTIDDHSRVGFSRVLPDEIANSACTHLLAAIRHYRSLDVKIKPVMADNGAAYRSRRFVRLLRRLKIEHLRTSRNPDAAIPGNDAYRGKRRVASATGKREVSAHGADAWRQRAENGLA